MGVRAKTTLGGALGAAFILGLAAGPASAQERTEECRCVDRSGEEIENCRCLRTPDVTRALNFAFRSAPRAQIGVMVRTDQQEEYDGRGVLIQEVAEDSPAQEAGLREGDVVVRVDGHSVLRPLADEGEEERLDEDRSLPVQRFTALVGDLEPGEEVEIEYVRDGRTLRATVVPEKAGFMVRSGDWDLNFQPRVTRFPARFRSVFPDSLGSSGVWTLDDDEGVRVFAGSFDPCFSSSASSSDVNRLVIVGGDRCVDGLHLQSLNPQLAEYFGVAGGVLVTEVEEEATLGLRAGDVIVAIGERDVGEPADVRRILRSYEADEPVSLTVVRKGQEMQVRGTRR